MADVTAALTEEVAHAIVADLGRDVRDVGQLTLDILQAHAVFLLARHPYDLPEGSYVYHVDDASLPASVQEFSCALLSDVMPRHNGVFFRHGHEGLCCSWHSCPHKVCPFALAACLAQIDPSEHEALLGLVDEREGFLARWKHLYDGSDQAFNLLFAPAENDFAGSIVSDDDRYVADFVGELAALLVSMGKIDTAEPMRRHLSDLLMSVGPSGFGMSSDGLLPGRRLIVVDRLSDLRTAGQAEEKKPFLAEHLGRIVDDRYVLLVGNDAEVSEVVRLGDAMRLAFGGHEIHLASTSPAEVLDAYLGNLDENLRAKADEQFREKFLEFVKDRSQGLPYRGVELADYLAKLANSKGDLTLPQDRFAHATLDEMLDTIVGLPQVKGTIRELERFALMRKRLEREGVELAPANMHMLFEGSPGTGKTMVARMVATMLHRIGITRLDKCVEVSSKDLIAKYVGHTDKQVHEKVLEALGGVLFIDEAYGLISEDGSGHEGGGGFGKQALAELVKCMEDYKDDLIIIFAGYEHEMQELVKVNPGMSSRIGYTFRFDDYTVDELIEIFKIDAERSNLVAGEDAIERVKGIVSYFRRFRSFGNGRFVAELVHKANVNHANRIDVEAATREELFTLGADDIPTRQEMFDLLDWKARSADELLEPIVGLETVKEGVRRLEKVVAYREEATRMGVELPDQNLNMLFLGNPGTGKTTMARIVGDVLYNIGAVPSNNFREIQAKDLVSGISGRTGEKVTEVVEDVMGGVLFIDEAYALLETGGGEEALAALVKHMSDHKGELVVIFAGYSREMRAFVDRNPGLASRIGYTFDFEDYKPEELTEIFRRKTEKCGLTLGEGVLEEIQKVFKYFHGVENFGNGRFVDQVIQETITKRAQSFDGSDLTGLLTIHVEDLPTIEELCKVIAAAVYDPSDLSDDQALLRVAKHEMGHAICRLARTGKSDIVMVTIEQEGNGALGYVQHKANSVALPTSDDLKAEMTSLLGGMAAEQLCFGLHSAGNSSDLRQATRVAARYVGTYGMSDAGLVQYVDPENQHAYELDRLSDVALKAMADVLDECLEDAKRAIEENRAAFDAMAQVLMDEKTITGERVMELWEARESAGGED